MKDTSLLIRMSIVFKARLKKGAEFYSINMTQFIIQSVNNELERMEAKK